MADLLEGVTSRTTRGELMERLEKAANLLSKQGRDERKKIKEIEARIKAKAKPGTTPKLMQGIILASEEEWKAAVAFLEEWDDYLPVALKRVREGGQRLLEQKV